MPCFLTFNFKFRLLAEPKLAHNSRAFYIRHFSVSDAEYILSPFKLTRGVLHTLQGRKREIGGIGGIERVIRDVNTFRE